MPVGAAPQARQFLRRNKLISGMSLRTFVMKTALRSGSLIAAWFTVGQGRKIFAIPRSPFDPRRRSTNDLFRTGAILVENADHIQRELPRQISAPQQVFPRRQQQGMTKPILRIRKKWLFNYCSSRRYRLTNSFSNANCRRHS